MDGAEQGHVALAQLEPGAVADAPGQHAITDQGPGLHVALLALVLKRVRKIRLRDNQRHDN